MKTENKKFLIGIAILGIIIAGSYGSLILYSGMGTPFSVVTSQSMQHDPERSELGIIDTGDLVIVKDKDKAVIQSYVKGTETGYSTFGDYGSVIIYQRDFKSNPVIHRAIVWLDWNPDTETWSSEELKNYKGEWFCTKNIGGSSVETKDPDDLGGILTFRNLTQSHKSPSLNLDNLTKISGYATMGDNPVSNLNFDQTSGIINHLIEIDDIKSVPTAEVPWIGVIKLLTNGNTANLKYVPNSLPSLIMTIVTLIGLISFADLSYQYYLSKKKNEGNGGA